MRILGPTGGWKRRAAGLMLGLGAAGGLAGAQNFKPDTSTLSRQPIAITATPIAAFDKTEASRTQFGRLAWRSGVVLTAPSANFGGWSGLVVGADGRSLLAVSDAGTWLTGELTYGAGGQLTGVSDGKIGPLKARDGTTLSRRRDRDAESIVLEQGTLGSGAVLMAFEQNDRIGRFPIGAKGLGAPSEYLTLPPEAKAMHLNGMETVAILGGGRQKGAIVAIAEEASRDGRHNGWIWQDGKPQKFTIGDAAGFSVTDAKGLPDGSLIVLERSFRWTEGVNMRISRLAPNSLTPGAAVRREVLMEADMDQNIDNMEGLAIHTNAAGETILTLISDDNFNPLFQRTEILQFALDQDGRAEAPVEARASAKH
jgi:hypothetical protein